MREGVLCYLVIEYDSHDDDQFYLFDNLHDALIKADALAAEYVERYGEEQENLFRPGCSGKNGFFFLCQGEYSWMISVRGVTMQHGQGT